VIQAPVKNDEAALPEFCCAASAWHAAQSTVRHRRAMVCDDMAVAGLVRCIMAGAYRRNIRESSNVYIVGITGGGAGSVIRLPMKVKCSASSSRSNSTNACSFSKSKILKPQIITQLSIIVSPVLLRDKRE